MCSKETGSVSPLLSARMWVLSSDLSHFNTDLVDSTENIFGTNGGCDGMLVAGGIFQGTFNLIFYTLKSQNYKLDR